MFIHMFNKINQELYLLINIFIPTKNQVKRMRYIHCFLKKKIEYLFKFEIESLKFYFN